MADVSGLVILLALATDAVAQPAALELRDLQGREQSLETFSRR